VHPQARSPTPFLLPFEKVTPVATRAARRNSVAIPVECAEVEQHAPEGSNCQKEDRGTEQCQPLQNDKMQYDAR
jgi:hypothetical protein